MLDGLIQVASPDVDRASLRVFSILSSLFIRQMPLCGVALELSPKSSATLCRRILQRVLHDRGIKKRSLADEIEEFCNQNDVPSGLIELLTILRTVGNYAAHPKVGIRPGEVVEVNTNEAELMLDIISKLFDFCYVRPLKQKMLKEKIDKRYRIKKS